MPRRIVLYPRYYLVLLVSLLCLVMGTMLVRVVTRAQQQPPLNLPAIYAPPMGYPIIAAVHIDSALTGEADALTALSRRYSSVWLVAFIVTVCTAIVAITWLAYRIMRLRQLPRRRMQGLVERMVAGFLRRVTR